MGEIKSAAEIAKEKIEKLGELTDDERLKWKYVPEGEKLAARYLKEDINLVIEIKKYDDKAKKIIGASVNDILTRNISLPRSEAARKTNKKAMDGIKSLKNNKAAVEYVFNKMRRVLDHYVQEGTNQKKQAYESLKNEMEARMQQAIKQKTGVSAKMKIDVEKQPQFQEQWQRVEAQMEGQYEKAIDEYKHELAVID